MPSINDAQVRFYVDSHDQEVYEVSYPELGLVSCVSSAHLVEERKIQLLRLSSSPANISQIG
jgi:hypothetical protein